MEDAIIYARVSTKDQSERFSLQAQDKGTMEYAKKHNFRVVKTWSVAESAWGKKERQGFNQLIEYAKKHNNVKHIIFDVLDRMTRNDFDKIKIVSLIKDYGKTVHLSRTNKIYSKESSPDDEFMMDIEVATAKKMSTDISRKTKMGMTEKAEQGIFPSHAPIGYSNNPITRGIDIDLVYSPLIKELFEKIASGSYSLFMVGNLLYEKGLRNPSTNKKLCIATLHRTIHNPIYYGAFIWGKKLYTGTHEPLISKHLWDKANEALEGKARPYIAKRNFPYNNILRCGACGCTYGGALHKNKYRYYACSNSKKAHKRKYYTESEIEKMFGSLVSDISLPSNMANWLEKGIKEKFGRKALSLKSKEERIQIEHDKTYRDLAKWYQLKAETEMHPQIFADRETALKRNLTRLEVMLKECKQDPKANMQEAFKTLELVKGLEMVYPKATNYQKAEIIKLIGEGYIMQENAIIPTYRAPFNIIAETKQKALPLGEKAFKSSNQNTWGG